MTITSVLRAQTCMLLPFLTAILLPGLAVVVQPPVASAAPEMLSVPSPSMGRDIRVQFQGGAAPTT